MKNVWIFSPPPHLNWSPFCTRKMIQISTVDLSSMAENGLAINIDKAKLELVSKILMKVVCLFFWLEFTDLSKSKCSTKTIRFCWISYETCLVSCQLTHPASWQSTGGASGESGVLGPTSPGLPGGLPLNRGPQRCPFHWEFQKFWSSFLIRAQPNVKILKSSLKQNYYYPQTLSQTVFNTHCITLLDPTFHKGSGLFVTGPKLLAAPVKH